MKKGGHPLLVFFVCALCLLMGIFIGRNQRKEYEILSPNTQIQSAPSVQTEESYLLDINTATATQLQELPGIGAVIAQRIVDYRNANGVFQSIEDLMNVEGIGEKKLQAIEELIKAGG